MLENKNIAIAYFNPELFAQLSALTIQKDADFTNQSNLSPDDKKVIIREKFPLLISVSEAKNLGITRNNFYDIANKHPELTVGIQQRKFLDRDKLFAWLDNGGDNKLVKGVA